MEKQNRLLKITCAVLVVLLALFMIYSFVQRGLAQAKEEEALTHLVRLKECEVEALKQREYAAQANLEAENQKRMAEEAYRKMIEAHQKIK